MTEKTKKAKIVGASAQSVEAPARITHREPRKNDEGEKLKARKLAGEYRVIHGSLAVSIPEDARRKPDGTINEHAPTFEYAKMGDRVWLNDADAARAIDADLVEPLDARPSRVGKVFVPPKASRTAQGAGAVG